MIKEPQALIIHKESWKDYHALLIKSSKIASLARPGQFIMVRVSPHPYPLLRRPFSIHARKKDSIEIFFQKKGTATEILASKKPDDSLDILGPLGKGFSLEPWLKGKTVFLVGGGRGIAPLYFLACELSSLGASVKIFYGGENTADLCLKEKFERNGFDIFYSTEDGTSGFKGLVSDLVLEQLHASSPHHLYACGPEGMMRTIARIISEKDIPGEFSLESIMGCGFGACWGCVKRIKKEKKESWLKICEEGPVFPGEEIVWSEEEK